MGVGHIRWEARVAQEGSSAQVFGNLGIVAAQVLGLDGQQALAASQGDRAVGGEVAGIWDGVGVAGHAAKVVWVQSCASTVDRQLGDVLGRGDKWPVGTVGLAADVVVVGPVHFFAPGIGG